MISLFRTRWYNPLISSLVLKIKRWSVLSSPLALWSSSTFYTPSSTYAQFQLGLCCCRPTSSSLTCSQKWRPRSKTCCAQTASSATLTWSFNRELSSTWGSAASPALTYWFVSSPKTPSTAITVTHSQAFKAQQAQITVGNIMSNCAGLCLEIKIFECAPLPPYSSNMLFQLIQSCLYFCKRTTAKVSSHIFFQSLVNI